MTRFGVFGVLHPFEQTHTNTPHNYTHTDTHAHTPHILHVLRATKELWGGRNKCLTIEKKKQI